MSFKAIDTEEAMELLRTDSAEWGALASHVRGLVEEDERGLLTVLEALSSADLPKGCGYVRILGRAGVLAIKKSGDYNRGLDRDDYFPFGMVSYAQMLWVKVLRIVTLVRTGGDPSFESLLDSCLDIINYSAFMADRLTRDSGRGS